MASVKSPPSSPPSSLQDLPKTWTFTSKLPCDAKYLTPTLSHAIPREDITPRIVKNALYTYVRPAPTRNPELLAVSTTALRTLNIAPEAVSGVDFLAVVSGNEVLGYEPDEPESTRYPWAQCYGGYQFGSWAGQLGDGRAISLFETTPPPTAPDRMPTRYELQLKGAGLTPYSRFADGLAVLRSSIREFVVSEYLHAIGIPSTRALSLVLTPHSRVRRETIEPGAIVCRFAQSWLRIGTFDLPRARGDRHLIRTLADYVLNEVIPCHTPMYDIPDPEVITQLPKLPDCISNGNRYTHMYHRIAQLNALTLARWQAYGFMNGVLNTDNTSILGLSMDFGPFAFMDDFDPQYTPNHDDHMLRYSFKNQPSIIWWNLVRLGEAVGELIGVGEAVDDADFIKNGIEGLTSTDASADGSSPAGQTITRAEETITAVGESYKATFLYTYKNLMAARLGLKTVKEGDFEELISGLLDMMHELSLDLNHFFRRLSNLAAAEAASDHGRLECAQVFFHHDSPPDAAARERVASWLAQWHARLVEDWIHDAAEDGTPNDNKASAQGPSLVGGGITESIDAQRIAAMKRVNPNFVPRGWILDEVIRRVDKEGDRAVLERVMRMVAQPFGDELPPALGRGNDHAVADVDADADQQRVAVEEWDRWCGDVPRQKRSMQCSCSS